MTMNILRLHPVADSNRMDSDAPDTFDRLFALDAMEDEGSAWHRLGSLRLRRQIGMALPRYWYHLGEVVHAAPSLNLFRREQVLLLGNDFTAASELADIRVEAEDCAPGQHEEILEALIRTGLLMLDAADANPATSIEGDRQVIAELPGVRLSNGASPFWEGLGRFFHDVDPAHGLREYGPAWRSHVASLLPRHPMVVSLLQSAAREAIGQVCESATDVRDALVAQGFGPSRHVGIIDAGPVYCAEVRHRQTARVRDLTPTDSVRSPPVEPWLIKSWHADEVWKLPAEGYGQSITLTAALLERSGLQTDKPVLTLPWNHRT
jgi:arginine/ornithine succinyltransferase subunit-like protein